jgi:hypothetical protein
MSATAIADVLDVAPETARAYRHAGICPRCGGPKVRHDARTCVLCVHADAPSIDEVRAWVVERLRAWTDETGTPPRATDWSCAMDGTESRWEREYAMWPTIPTVQRAFGSWNAGLAAAGLELHRQGWDELRVLDALRRFIDQTERAPTQKELLTVPGMPKYGTVVRYFGDWQDALRVAGGQAARRKAWTRDELVDALRRFAAEHGRPPTRGDLTGIHGSGYPAGSVVERTFGTFTAALVAAGLDLHGRPRAATTEDMLQALRTYSDRHGAWPNSQRWRDVGGWLSTSAIIRRFGSWATAMAEASTATNLVGDLRDVA